MILRTASSGELDARALYALLRLRSQVFVVEQREVYLDLDGKDLLPGTRHCWLEEHGEVLACARILDDPTGGSVIGRVVTEPHARGRGLATRLVRHAIDLARPPIRLDAQAHLQAWYETFGFEVTGPAFTYPGEQLPHVPMALT